MIDTIGNLYRLPLAQSSSPIHRSFNLVLLLLVLHCLLLHLYLSLLKLLQQQKILLLDLI